MRKILKNISVSLFFVVLFSVLTFSCFALENGKITVTLRDKEKNNINGITVYACHIAEVADSGFAPTKAFENSGISISSVVKSPNQLTAKAIADYVKKNKLETLSAVSEDGKAIFSDLGIGIWVVYCEENLTAYFNPYIVFIPYESGGKLYYEVNSAPKIDNSNPEKIDVYVLKKWDDKNNVAKKRPESVTVSLLDGGAEIDLVKLSEENGWAHTFTGLSKDGNYSVKEKKVENYTVQYSGDVSNGFIVTNSYNGEKLPQTGQLWWPIVIISVTGIAFVLLGIIELGARKNGKKNK